MSDENPRKLLPYADCRGLIRDGDLCLFRGRGLASLLLKRAGRGNYSHSAIAGWWNERLMLLESRQWVGGRAVLLSSQVERYPGQIDVFRCQALSSEQRAAIVRIMQNECGQPYSYAGILRLSLLHLPAVRLLSYANTDDDDGGSAFTFGPRFCSWGTSAACRLGAGLDLVPQLADRFTEPNDQARSALLRYQFTPVPNG